jgi:hypothetical protein
MLRNVIRGKRVRLRRRRRLSSSRSSVGSIARYFINQEIERIMCLKASKTFKTSLTSKKNTNQLPVFSLRVNRPQKAKESISKKPNNLHRSSMSTIKRRTSTLQLLIIERRNLPMISITRGKVGIRIMNLQERGNHRAKDQEKVDS